MGASIGTAGHNSVYDFHLDQWGLTKSKNETYKEFLSHLMHSSAWKDSKDIALWDLGPDGAAQLNDYVQIVPHVHCRLSHVLQQIDESMYLYYVFIHIKV